MSPSLKERVCDAGFSGDQEDLLVDIITNEETVKIASLENQNINDEQLALIAEALHRNTHVTRLNLRSNEVTDATPLADVVKANTTLQAIVLSENQLTPESLCALGSGLRSNNTLSTLELDKSVREDGIASLVTGFISADPPSPDPFPSLHADKGLAISLRDCDLGNTGSHALAQLIRATGRLVRLNLLGTRMTAEDAKILGTAAGCAHPVEIQVNPALQGPLYRARQAAPVEPVSPPKPVQQSPSPQSSPGLSSSTSTATSPTKHMIPDFEKDIKDKQEKISAQLAEIKRLTKKNSELKAHIQKLESKTEDLGTRLEKAEAVIEEKTIEQSNEKLRLWMHEKAERDLEGMLHLNIPLSQIKLDKDTPMFRGGFGVVQSGTFAGHRVAVKRVCATIYPHLHDILCCDDETYAQVNGDPDSIEAEDTKRLLREALVLLTLRHPHVVTFLGLSFDRANSMLLFVLSWADNGCLFDLMHAKKRKLDKAERNRILMEVAGALEFLHAHGIVHRDLKSPNVLLDAVLSAKVTDFGLSGVQSLATKKLSNVAGTFLWASPEQLRGDSLTLETDVFSFGVLMWEVMLNLIPWEFGQYKGKNIREGKVLELYNKGTYLPVKGKIEGETLPRDHSQLLRGCFDKVGHRLTFSQLHAALRRHHAEAVDEQEEYQRRRETLLQGRVDDPWKFSPAVRRMLESEAKQLEARPSVSIAALDLKSPDHYNVVEKLLREVGGQTGKQGDTLVPFGVPLAGAAVTWCLQKLSAFNGAVSRDEARYCGFETPGHPFHPRYRVNDKGLPAEEERMLVLQHATRLPGLPSKLATRLEPYHMLDDKRLKGDAKVRLQRVFHGVPSLAALEGILAGDFAPLQATDQGWFGAGIYFTPDLDYALGYADPVQVDKLPAGLEGMDLALHAKYSFVLACDVLYCNPFPVVGGDDKAGQPLTPGHGSHVAVTDFSAGDVAKANIMHSSDWAKQGARPVVEIAISDSSCILLRGILAFSTIA